MSRAWASSLRTGGETSRQAFFVCLFLFYFLNVRVYVVGVCIIAGLYPTNEGHALRVAARVKAPPGRPLFVAGIVEQPGR